MAMTKVKSLQLWCKKMADGYRDVNVKDMTSSWKDGLACCAIIHRFRPDLIDFNSLAKENVFDNNHLAFEVAENELGIPALLDATDMVEIRVPDRLSVVTYISQYYNYFHDKPQLGGPSVEKTSSLKRPQTSEDSSSPQAKRFTPQKQNRDQTPVKKPQGSIGDKCTICHEKVYLLERLIDSNKLYHRTCFRQSDLSPTSKMYPSPSESNYWQRQAKDNDKMPDLVTKLNEMKKRTLSSKRNLNNDSSQGKFGFAKITEDSSQSKPLWKQSHPNNINSEHPRVPSPVEKTSSPQPSPRIGKPGSDDRSSIAEAMDTSTVSKGKPRTTGAAMDLSLGTVSKPQATPRGNGKKSMDSGKPVDGDHLVAPPRTKSSKSSSSSNVSTESRSPPPLPASRPPSVAPPRDNHTATSPAPVFPEPPSLPHKPCPSPGIVSSSKHSPGIPLPNRPKSPPRLKSPTNVITQKDTITPLPDTKSQRDTITPLPDKKYPRSSPKFSVFNEKTENAPPKPARSLQRGITASDMEEANRLMEGGDAVLVTPQKPGEDKNKNVLSGLLSNLANVREREEGAKTKSSNTDENTSHADRPTLLSDNSSQGKSKPRVMRRAVIPPSTPEDMPSRDVEMKDVNVKPSDKTVIKPVIEPAKPIKSVVGPTKPIKSVVGPTKPVTSVVGLSKPDTYVVKPAKVTEKSETDKKESEKISNGVKTDDIPAWKKRLVENRRVDIDGEDKDKLGEKNNGWSPNLKRPKEKPKVTKSGDDSNKDVDVDRNTKQNLGIKSRPPRPKTPEILSTGEAAGKASWQIDAEKRLAAHQAGYVDPEKDKHWDRKNKLPKPSVEDKPLKIVDSKRPEVKRRVLPTPIMDSDQISNLANKKKLAVDVKFDFEDPSYKEKESLRSPPPRPPLPSPNDIREPRRSIKKKSPGSWSPGWCKDGDFRKMSPLEIQTQLMDIDSKLTDLELRGRHLEDSIRKAVDEDEGMMAEWFHLVNSKNELVRREAELTYVTRTLELEDEQQDIDRQMRELLEKPDVDKTEEEKVEEEQLLEKLIDVVNQRSVIVDSQDEDRIRYEEEDRDIAVMLQSKGFVKSNPEVQ